MTNLRPMLWISLLVLAYLLWVEWQKDYHSSMPPAQPPVAAGSADVPVPGSGAADLPEPVEAPAPGETDLTRLQEPGAPGETALITVTSDVLQLGIDPVGGTVVSAVLLDYPADASNPTRKVDLLQRAGPDLFIAQSGLLSSLPAPNHTTPYQAAGHDYVLTAGAEELRVPLTWESETGLRVTKTFVLKPGRYDIEVLHRLDNDGAEPWSGSRYDQLQRALTDTGTAGGFTNPEAYSFKGIGFYNPQDKFEKLAFEDVQDEPFSKVTPHGWFAMIQHYFFAAWIPPADEETTYSTQQIAPGGWPRYIARAVSPVLSVAPGASAEFRSRLFIGPKLQEELEGIAPGLVYTVNYGIFTVFSKPLFWLLKQLHDLVGNWGWAIVLLTVLIKLAFFKLTEAQYRSMARMRKLQPRIEQLKERFGDDRQRMSQAMMELYKKEKVNPLGGCLPILVQIPIFIALYWVLLESVELRQAPFIGWITNLSERDPYFILPALNAVFMIVTQRLTPMAGMDPLQRKLMNLMPVIFAVMFAFFPAGLVLYWATNAGLSLAQQLYITRKLNA